MYANQVNAKNYKFCAACAKRGITSELVQFSVSFEETVFLFIQQDCFSHLVVETFPASLRGRNVKKGHYFLIRQILQNKFVPPQDVMKNFSTLVVLPWSKDSSI